MIKLIFLSFLWISNQPIDEALSVAQSREAMLCKEWKVRFFETAGVKEYPDAAEENDRFIFYANYTMQMIEAGEGQDCLWEYNRAKEQLIITDRVSKEKRIMKVVLLTKDELVLQMTDADGSSSTVHLVPVK